MNWFNRAAMAIGLLLALPAPVAMAKPPAREQQSARPALWLVEDEDTRIYLFGTLHLMKPGQVWFDGAVKKAFDSSDELVTEIRDPDSEEIGRLMATLAPAPEGSMFRARLSDKGKANYAAALAALGMTPDAFDTLDPWAAAMFIQLAMLDKLGFDRGQGAETILTEAARTAGKTLGGLETAAFQLRLFDGMADDVQIAFLESSVESMQEQQAMIDRMAADWAAGNAEGLARLMNETLDESPELHRLMLTDRNRTWSEWIADRLDKPGTVFLAVGAGHLAGNDSVQDFLKRRLAGSGSGAVTIRRIHR